MKIEIIQTDANIGWKETDFGKSSSTIVDYPTLEAMLEGEGFYDENYDEDEDDDETEYSRMIKAINTDGGFMCDNYDRSYWHNPEPCDSYLTYGVYFSFSILTEEQFNKIENEKQEKLNKKIAKNNSKWEEFFEGVDSLEKLKENLKNYEFPRKL